MIREILEDNAYLERIGYVDEETKIGSKVTWAQLLEAWENSQLNPSTNIKINLITTPYQKLLDEESKIYHKVTWARLLEAWEKSQLNPKK